jgi:hypothetical protein
MGTSTYNFRACEFGDGESGVEIEGVDLINNPYTN